MTETTQPAEVTRLHDEIDARETGSDQGATREIDLRVERDEARRFARRFRWLAFDGCDNGTSVFRQLGLDKLPDWFDAATPEPDLSNKPIGWIDA